MYVRRVRGPRRVVDSVSLTVAQDWGKRLTVAQDWGKPRVRLHLGSGPGPPGNGRAQDRLGARSTAIGVRLFKFRVTTEGIPALSPFPPVPPPPPRCRAIAPTAGRLGAPVWTSAAIRPQAGRWPGPCGAENQN